VFVIAIGIAMTAAAGVSAASSATHPGRDEAKSAMVPSRSPCRRRPVAGHRAPGPGHSPGDRPGTRGPEDEARRVPPPRAASQFVFAAVGKSSASSSPASRTWWPSSRSSHRLYAPRFYLKYRQGKRRGLRLAAAGHITLLANSLRADQASCRDRARPPRGPTADQRGVRARRARDAARPGAPAGAEQPRPPRGVGGPGAVVTAIQIQSQVGGNLATVLDAIPFTIRERVRIKARSTR